VPVLVTGAHRALPRRLAARLLEEGGEVRVYGSGDTSALRAAGAFVATGTADDEGRLEAALAEVHTVVHVGRGVAAPDPDALVTEARVLARAAGNAGVRRLIGLSIAGAAEDADDPLRRAAAEVEQVLADAAPPSVAVRTSLVDTPAMRDALVTGGFGPRLRHVEVAPVRPADLVELVVAFDRARSRAATGHLVVSADGPSRLSVAAYLERVGMGTSRVGRRLPDPGRTATLAAALGGPWWTDDELVLDGWGFAAHVPSPPGVAG
jgi:hypothetical protein